MLCDKRAHATREGTPRNYRPPPKRTQKKAPKSWDEEFLENWKPGVVPPNKYVQVATAVLLVGLAIYSSQLVR